MICPRCHNEKTEVKTTSKSYTTERYRKCPVCGFAFITLEAMKFDPNLRAMARKTFETNSLFDHDKNPPGGNNPKK